MILLERYIENYLIGVVTTRGGAVRKVQWIGRRGAPDRVVMLPGGKILFVELKKPGEPPTEQQLIEHDNLRKLGQLVYVADSIEGVDALFE